METRTYLQKIDFRVSVVRIRNGNRCLCISATFTINGNTQFHPVKAPLYTCPMNACRPRSTALFCGIPSNTVSFSHCAHLKGNPTSVHTLLYQPPFRTNPLVSFSTGEQAVVSPQMPQHLNALPGCSTSLLADFLPIKDSTFQDLVEIQRKQEEVCQIIVIQKQGVFHH